MGPHFWRAYGIWIFPAFVLIVLAAGWLNGDRASTKETFEWLTDYAAPWIIIVLLLVLIRRLPRR
ncbi:hypothetical protein B8V81_4133 [Paenibacillus pasadenensis]|uniref:Uncharacterized protein n=1 Tax=Paenibacillus pasadenensis TaxID=217090 RepID=A0A2N5N5U9_9BACL|nr:MULTISPECIES: hypothetical protein [Paenibacillus]PLT45702.1 hypothetical protein B8V81_4133 [Paenibacillus pasadenensis]QGG56146.1 hypothetical protein GE073_11530 [Paenibacillus sp. B01]